MANFEDEATAGESVAKVAKRMLAKAAGWLAIYLIGYFDLSVAWLIGPLALTVLRQQWKAERDFRLAGAREAALADEETMIKSRIQIEDLPAWVFFPDKERVEWLNSIVKQLWPKVGQYARSVVSSSVEPAVRASLKSYGLSGFRFDRVALGRVPPRATGVKVYEKNVSRDEIILDVDVVFASDCDVRFSLKKVQAKVSDFSLKGTVRIVMKPLVAQIPLVGGLQVYFLTEPDIDFDLGGVASALDAPGLSSMIRRIMLEQLGYYMLLPNKITIALADSVSKDDLNGIESAGVLRVRLERAENLMKKDVGFAGLGKSDPFAVLSVGAKKATTAVVSNTVSPKWDLEVDFPVEVVGGQQLLIEVFDKDDHSENDFLGRATVAASVVEDRGRIPAMWADLEEADSGRILLSLEWLEARADPSAIKEGSTCLVHVFVDSVRGLESTGELTVELTVGSSSDSQRTPAVLADSDPVAFERGFVFTASNPGSDDLHVSVRDKKDAAVGTASIRLSDMAAAPGMEYAMQPFTLKGAGGAASIFLAANLRALASKGAPAPSPEKEVEKVEERELPVPAPSLDEMVGSTIGSMVETTGHKVDVESILRQRSASSTAEFGRVRLTLKHDQDTETLTVTVHEAKSLPGGDLPDPPDPYVKIYLLPSRSKKSKRKSDTKKDTVCPVYEETFEYDGILSGQLASLQLEISVVDRKGIFARRSTMGKAIVDLDNPEIVRGFTSWYNLVDVEEDSD